MRRADISGPARWRTRRPRASVPGPVKPALTLATAALLAAAAGSCSGQQVRVNPATSKALGSPEDICRTASAEVPAFPDGGHQDLVEGFADAPDLALPPPRPRFQSTPLLPPGRPGESVSDVQGCLAATERTAAAGARFPAPVDRPADAVRVNPLGGGLILTHEAAHPCCVQASVSASVEGASVKVLETLSGTPCGCRCASRLRTAVALPPGRYSVSLLVRGPDSGERAVFSGPATVPGE